MDWKKSIGSLAGRLANVFTANAASRVQQEEQYKTLNILSGDEASNQILIQIIKELYENITQLSPRMSMACPVLEDMYRVWIDTNAQIIYFQMTDHYDMDTEAQTAIQNHTFGLKYREHETPSSMQRRQSSGIREFSLLMP